MRGVLKVQSKIYFFSGYTIRLSGRYELVFLPYVKESEAIFSDR